MSLINIKEAPRKNEPIGELEGQKYYNASYSCFPKVELNFKDTNYSRERSVAINCNSKDGVKPMTKEEQDFERKLNWELVKRFTMAIFKMDITHFSFPVGYNEPRTFVERATDLFSFLVTEYIDKALEQTDPKDRLGYLAAGIIAGFHLYLQQKKPWNPLLGETYVGEWPNGTRMYAEQTCHHPPVSDMQIIPAHGDWRIDAQFNFAIDAGAIRTDILQHGLTKLILKDGTVFEWEFPNMAVTGILTGDRIIRILGPFKMYDKTNNLELYLTVNPSFFEDKKFKSQETALMKMTPEEVEAKIRKQEETEEGEENKDTTTPQEEVKYKVTSVQGGIRTTGTEKFVQIVHGDYCKKVCIKKRKLGVGCIEKRNSWRWGLYTDDSSERGGYEKN